SLERQLSFAMDVTYVTEKIIVVTFPESGLDTTYRSNLKEVTRMLRTKHGSKYTVFNLSEKRHDLAKLNNQILELGWPAHLSPPLERLCTICKSLDAWFHSDPQNVAVLHSKPGDGRLEARGGLDGAGQALRGDILIKCYHKKQRPAGRSPIFRVQFHTCTLSGDRVLFTKRELDDAVSDPRFPDEGQVELQFSQRPNDFRGNGAVNEVVVPVDHTKDPLVKQDSYENFDLLREDSLSDLDDLFESNSIAVSHAEGPLDGNLYAMVSKGKQRPPADPHPGAGLAPPATQDGAGGDVLDGPHTVSMDSGISSSSGLHNYGNPGGPGHTSGNPGHHRGVVNGGGTVEVEVHHTTDSNPRKSSPRDPLKSEHAELDSLLDGMLREIRSMPNHPASTSSYQPGLRNHPAYHTLPTHTTAGSSYSNPGHGTIYYSYTSRTGPADQPQRNGDHDVVYRWQEPVSDGFGHSLDHGGDDQPYHTRRTSSPFSYGVNPSSPSMQRRRAQSESGRHSAEDRNYGTLRDSSVSPEPVGSGSWLQKQQQKLRARRESSWDDRHRKEAQLMAELRSTTAMRSPELQNGGGDSPLNGESPSFKASSYSTPLHVHTASKPPIHRGLSAPTSPIIPSRSSSRDVTLRRYPQWQPQPLPAPSQPIVRQKSDTSFDRERPFVAARRSHQQARDQVAAGGTSPHDVIASSVIYGDPSNAKRHTPGSPGSAGGMPGTYGTPYTYGTPGTPGTPYSPGAVPGAPTTPSRDHILTLLSDPPFAATTRPGPARDSGPYKFEEPVQLREMVPVAQSTPNKYFQDDGSLEGSTSWTTRAADESPSASPASGADRPATPAFPVPPRTPYMNQDSPEVIHHHPVFVKDTSKYWYKPNISREEAISVLKSKPPGTFIVRDSNSFPGAFGLALKVASPPPNVQNRTGDLSNELVRHFLIEPTAKGVRLKGCANEPVFGSLSALVYQHSIPPLLYLPIAVAGIWSVAPTTATTASSLMQQGAACNVLYLCTMDMESLTGPQAVRRAVAELLAISPPPVPTVVHFKVSSLGITLTDNNRKLFFRRHYALNAISFCGTDPEDRRWTQKDEDAGVTVTSRCFGFVARKPASKTDNQCHLFAELEPEQPASAIVNFVGKVMDSAGLTANRANII
ncbi:tensin, putative, partial [Ixodes scapularis]